MGDVHSEVKERDEYTCQKCGYKPSSNRGQRLEAHHIVPDAVGGSDEIDNLSTLCKRCHDFAPSGIYTISYPELFETFSSTGLPPAYDFTKFGIKYLEWITEHSDAVEDVWKDGRSVEDAFDEAMRVAQEDSGYTTHRPTRWLKMAGVARYGDVERLTGRTQVIGILYQHKEKEDSIQTIATESSYTRQEVENVLEYYLDDYEMIVNQK